jgi:hypothetical protein
LEFSGGDFELWESQEHETKHYNISIEGYMGFEKISDIVDLYKKFIVKLEEYLMKHHEKTKKERWRIVYQTRDIKICYEGDCYWVFLDTFKSSIAWDTYYYMEDVIKQISEINEELISDN